MTYSVRSRADTVATFRFLSGYLMETLARWVPTTPELEVKIVFGRHVWEFAQHADAFGKRTAELRLALHASKKPKSPYMEVLDEIAAAENTAQRVEGCYAAMLPSLAALYQHYRDETDPIMDEPTIRILDRALADLQRMEAERESLRQERPDIALGDDEWFAAIRSKLELASSDVVDFRPAPQPTERS